MMVNFKLVAKFVWCGLIAPFFGMVAIIILLPILLPLAMVGIGVLALHERWDEFKRTEAAASSRATNGVQPTDADCPLGIGWHGEVCFCSAGTCAKCRATNGVQEKRNG